MERLPVENKKGQALIEFLLAITSFTAFLFSLFFLIYLGLAYAVTDQLLYEGLICVASQESQSNCERKLKKKLSVFSSLTIRKVKLRSHETYSKGDVFWILKKEEFFYKKTKILKEKSFLKAPRGLRLYL